MRGDFSRVTFRPESHYRAVLQQQGRVTVDADFNEQADIVNHRLDDTSADIIGPAGRPQNEFVVAIAGGNLNIGAGTLYLDGIPCVNDGCTLTTQPYLPLDSAALANFPDLSPGPGAYAVYLRVFERLVTAIEDPLIRETALGGPDTCVRSQMVWQVRLRMISPAAGATCANVGDAWKAPFTPGAMTAQTVTVAAGDSPCVLPPRAGFRGLENQLYRVEIHQGGPFATATFKWSRENGSVVTAVVQQNAADTQTSGPILSVASTGRDSDVGFGDEQFVELLDDRIELSGTVQPLSSTKDVRAALNQIELHAAAALPVRFANSPKLRRWDQDTGDANGIPVSSTAPIALGNSGIAVTFASGDYRRGDYWLIPARTAIDQQTGTIQWPADGSGNFLPQKSRYVEHQCLLTVVSWNGTALSAFPGFDMCVPEFPPLTNITAQGDCCTLVVRPGANWMNVFNSIPSSGAHICFQAGTYTLDKRIDIQGKTAIIVSGLGDAAKIVVSDESALHFVDCDSVTVRDLSAQANNVQKNSGAVDGILGVVGVKNAKDVWIENCRLTCADGPYRTAACVSIHSADRAIVCGNRLSAGVQQVGVLFSNVKNVVAEDNLITGSTKSIGTVGSFLTDPQFVAAVRTRLASHIVISPPAGPPPPNTVNVTLGGKPVRFTAPSTHITAWTDLLNQKPLTGTPANPQIIDHINELANGILQANNAPAFSGIRATILGNITPSSQGITVGGTVGELILISGNRVASFIQGIHVGLSAPNPNVSVADRVTIQDNRLNITLGSGATRGRHGIYVGNVSSLKIRNNRLTLERPAGAQNMQSDGIRVFGRLGRSLIIRENHLDGFTVGINFVLRGATPRTPIWLITDNLADGSINPVLAPNIAKQENNVG